MQQKIIIVGQGLAGTLFAFFCWQRQMDFLVFDEGHETAASAVAAGLINPITGRRMVKSEDIDELFPFAKTTYQALEQLLDIKIWHERNLLWTLSSIKEENDWALRSDSEGVAEYIEKNSNNEDLQPFFKQNISFGEIKKAAQVDLPLLLQTFRAFLIEKKRLIEKKYELQNIENQLVVFCEGEKARFNPLWSHLPFVVAKGEALHLTFGSATFEKIIKNNVGIIPIAKNRYWVGSNYEWNPKDVTPTESIKTQFLDEVDKFLATPYEVVAHKAAIRPSTKDRRPMLGFHPENPNFVIFNGLGTKGTSLAPFWAAHFMEVLFGNEKLNKSVDIQRFNPLFLSKMKKNSLFILAFFSCISLFAQSKKETYDPKKMFTPAQLQADFTFLRNCLSEAHPGLYWYTSKDSLDKIFQNFSASLNKEMTEREFRNALFPILTEIRCGHSSLANSKARMKYLEKSQTKFIPFDIFSVDNQLFIKENFSKDSSLQKRSKILSINGQTSSSLVEQMQNSFVSDGYNVSHQKIRASRHFQLWYPRLFEEKDTFKIVLQDTLLQEKTLVLPAIVSRQFPFKVEKKSKQKPLFSNAKVNTFSFDTINPKIAILRIATFSPTGYWRLYRKAFAYMAENKTEHLVLDLRGNGGGMIFHPSRLLSYLIDKQEITQVYRKNKMPSFMNKTKSGPKFLKFTAWVFPKIPKRYGVETLKNDSIFSIKMTSKVRTKNHYHGKLYVLIDGNSFSATSLTAAFLKKNQRGIFIGEETGGGEKGCNAMVMSDLILPNTQLQYRFPFFRVEHDVQTMLKGRGIFPDIPIIYDEKSIIAGRDLEMEKVRNLVSSNTQ